MAPRTIAMAVSGLLCAAVAACSTTQLSQAQAACRVASEAGPILVVIADANGAPVDTTSLALKDLQATCAAIGGSPVPATTAGVHTLQTAKVVKAS